MSALGALVLDRLRLAWRGPSVACGAAAAAVATALAASLPGLDPSERARSAVAALSGLSTALGGLVIAAAAAARVAHERRTGRIAVERAAAAPRSAAAVAELAHVAAIALATAAVAAIGAGLAGGRDPAARPRPAARPDDPGASSEVRFVSPFAGGDARLSFAPVVRAVPPDVPPRVVEIEVSFAASGRAVRLRVSNEAVVTVPLEARDAGPGGEIAAKAIVTSPGYRVRIASAKVEGPPGSVSWNALAFGCGIAARLAVLGALGLVVGAVARPALASALVASLLAYGLFGGAAARFARELAERHADAGGLPWSAIATLARALDAIVPDLGRLSTSAAWADGEVIAASTVAESALRAVLFCAALGAISVALSRRTDVVASA